MEINSNITSTIIETINTLLGNLFSSIDNNIYDVLDDVTFIRFAFILKKAKEGMRKVLNINYAHLLSNEKSDPYVNVHFWLVPVNGITSPDLLDFNVKEYLNSFHPKEELDKIIEYNKLLKKYFEEINLAEQDNQLLETLTQKSN